MNIAVVKRPNGLIMAVLAAIIVFSASAIGGYATFPSIPTWYAGLAKPAFNPPNWIFGPVWTILYILMAIAFWRILIRPAGTEGKTGAVTAFVIQMALNAFWSIAFFGLRSPLFGLATIALLLSAIVITIALFARIDRGAAWLMAPYLLWVSFASVLNGAIFWLNR